MAGGIQWSTSALAIILASVVSTVESLAASNVANVGAILTPASLFPLQENVDSTKLFPMARCGSFKLEEATIDDMQKAMAKGTLTSVQLVQCYMLRNYQTDDYIK